MLLLRGKRVDEEDEAREGERERERERWLMGARPSGRANGKTKKQSEFPRTASRTCGIG